MRFGSIKAFLNFLTLLEGMGYSCLSPLYDIEKELKALPGFISQFHCDMLPMTHGVQIALYKHKQIVWYVTLQELASIVLDEEET